MLYPKQLLALCALWNGGGLRKLRMNLLNAAYFPLLSCMLRGFNDHLGRRMLSSEVRFGTSSKSMLNCSKVKWRPKSFRPFDWAILNERPG